MSRSFFLKLISNVILMGIAHFWVIEEAVSVALHSQQII